MPSPEWERALMNSIGKFVAQEIDKRAMSRIEQLEKILEQRRWVGVWAVGLYHEGNLVTHDGSMWHCNRDTDSKPGTSDAWTLCVKRGRDGKDGKNGADGKDGIDADNVRRLATAQRG
jgi:arginine/lysine/ornithine decarboxylase